MLKVMLVDDEEWCLEELSGMLISSGLVEITGTYLYASDVLEAAIRDGPDIIFIDVQMAGMSGLQLAQRIKSRLPHVFLVLLSEIECFARNGYDIGVDDYVLKPLKKERVMKALERAV